MRVLLISPTLLHPCFYLAGGLEPWIQERVARFETTRPARPPAGRDH